MCSMCRGLIKHWPRKIFSASSPQLAMLAFIGFMTPPVLWASMMLRTCERSSTSSWTSKVHFKCFPFPNTPRLVRCLFFFFLSHFEWTKETHTVALKENDKSSPGEAKKETLPGSCTWISASSKETARWWRLHFLRVYHFIKTAKGTLVQTFSQKARTTKPIYSHFCSDALSPLFFFFFVESILMWLLVLKLLLRNLHLLVLLSFGIFFFSLGWLIPPGFFLLSFTGLMVPENTLAFWKAFVFLDLKKKKKSRSELRKTSHELTSSTLSLSATERGFHLQWETTLETCWIPF